MGKFVDLTGQRFGMLTAIEVVGKDNNGSKLWKCRCDCGNEITATSGNLRAGKYKGCGCQVGKSLIQDLTGQRFGSLVVIKETEPYVSPAGNVSSRWLCQCDCGSTKIAKTADLNSGKIDNCGCKTFEKKSKAKKKDLTGLRFGKLFVVGLHHSDRRSYWNCKCDCGNEVIVKSDDLVQGHTQSCGCSRIIDLSGKRFGKLTVIEMVDTLPNDGARWLCRCDCGNEKIISTKNLLHSNHEKGTMSCGCLIKENHPRTHDKSQTRLYCIWQKIKQRCYNPSHKHYKYYGGRGITVCSEWKDDFQAFYDWSMANGYGDNLSIDREDFNGNYEPSNCRWATQKEQMNNTRNNRMITYNGKTQTMKQWSEELEINYSTIQGRLRRGCSVSQALSKEKLY